MRNAMQILSAVVAAMVAAASPVRAADPYADRIVSYVPGVDFSAGFDDPSVALGSPERMTGEQIGFPGVVSVASGPFGTDEIVSIGTGGQLTVQFDEPITNDPTHAFGVDLIVFGNSGFTWNFNENHVTTPAGLFGSERGRIEVSADNVTYFEVPGVFADALFPTQGFLDGGVFDADPGSRLSNFQLPVDPSLTLGDFDGLMLEAVRALYGGSGGGTPVDIGAAVDADGNPVDLGEIQFVRITAGVDGSPEIDAFVAVPEPATIGLLTVGLGLWVARRRRRSLSRAERSV